MTIRQLQIPPPNSWEELENILADLSKRWFGDPLATRFGRLGQRQHGIDILLYDERRPIAIQCRKVVTLTVGEIEEAAREAVGAFPDMASFIVATSMARDAALSKQVYDVNRARTYQVEIRLVFWDDLVLELDTHKDLLAKYYPGLGSDSHATEAILSKIASSETTDWTYADLHNTLLIYKPDARLQLVPQSFDENREFQQPWVEQYPDPHGFTAHHFVKYNGQLIATLFLVAVDGYRLFVPIPHILSQHKLKQWEYKAGAVINARGSTIRLHNYDEAIEASGSTVEE